MSRTKKLTAQDLKMLEAIRAYIDEHGYSPSYREIGDMVNLRSPNSVWKRMQKLYDFGEIETDLDISAPRGFRLKRRNMNETKEF